MAFRKKKRKNELENEVVNEEPKKVIREIPRDEYVPPEHPNIKEIPREEYVPPIIEESEPEEDTNEYKRSPIALYPVKTVLKTEKERKNGRAQVLNVVKQVEKKQIQKARAIDGIEIKTVEAKAQVKKRDEAVMALNYKTVEKKNVPIKREEKVEDFILYTKKVEKKAKTAQNLIKSYEEREDKVGEMYIEKAQKTRINELSAKKK